MTFSPHHRRMAFAMAIALALGAIASAAGAADALHDLVAGIAPGEAPRPVLVAGGFEFTEGPATDADGRVFFSDIPRKKIHVWTVPEGGVRAGDGPFEVETWLADSGSTNGLAWGDDGLLYACQMGESRRVVAIDPETKAIRPLAERHDGKRFNAPNDLWIDSSNAIWFTDPAYGRAPEELEIGAEAVWWISPDRTEVRRVADAFKRPNGIGMAPDGKTLYVADRGADVTWAYPVLGPGRVGERRTFTDAGFDGFAIDEHGNLYGTPKAKLVRVHAPDGSTIGEIPLPESPSNVTFAGPDRNTLVVTVKDKVFALPMKVRGGG